MNAGRKAITTLAFFRGNLAENKAIRFLEARGFKIIERNYRCRRGEIDLIMKDAETIVFVEVRYRKSDRFGSALESIDQRKRDKLIACANHYILARKCDDPVRFDVVGITSNGHEDDQFDWVQDAFQI